MRTITCKRCGSIYELTYERTITKDTDSIDCEICGKKLYSWNEAKIWSAQLIEQKENHKLKADDKKE